MTDKTNKYTTLIIIVSAILIAILFNIRMIFFLVEQLETKSFSEINDGVMLRFYFGIISFVFHILLFCVIAFFNYLRKDKLIPHTISKTGRNLLIIFANILIFYLIILAEKTIADYLFTGIGKRIGISYFFFANISIAGLGIAEAYFIILLRKIKTAEIENIQLKEEKMRAELSSLKEQISPHFFFNTLNSLGAVIRTENKSDSLDFVENMSRVYRYILESNQHDLVKLEDEIEFLNAYYFLLKKRFGNKLVLKIDISPDLSETSIPPMALQLLVENAIQHNIITNSSPLTINIYAENGLICVKNYLQKKAGNESMGIGLPNLLKRYQFIANKDIFINESEGSFIVKLPIIK